MKDFFSKPLNSNTKIVVVGLGYVGLPLAVEFGKKYDVHGIDVSQKKIDILKTNCDPSNELTTEELTNTTIHYTTSFEPVRDADVVVVTVPTPIDSNNQPNLTPIVSATTAIGKHLSDNTIIVYESTVYPGVTEEVCLPILEKESSLSFDKDFKLGYSPERISPGDVQHTLTKIMKIVSGSCPQTLEYLEALYGSIIPAGIYKASSIKVAEGAKVIENIQRDLNVALMNELAIIFNKMNIDTLDVIEAAATKWNFMKMVPGLVGGHCIDVDPYYLTYKAKQLGYYPQIILAGRRINSGMAKYIAEQTVKQLIKGYHKVRKSKVLILGITFKENVSDIRNSKVVNIVKELKEYEIETIICDPHADPEEVKEEFGIELTPLEQVNNISCIILAVSHNEFKEIPSSQYQSYYDASDTSREKVFVDVKSVYKENETFKKDFLYWRL